MARVILDGFRDYEEALAFAEWFGYTGIEVDTTSKSFVLESDLVSARIETGDVELDITTHDAVYQESDIAPDTDFNIFDDEEI